MIYNNIKLLYNIMERPISGVSGATVPEREMCQFSDPPVDFAGYSATGCGVYTLFSSCLSYKESLENLPAAGGRLNTDGTLTGQGTSGLYWSSTATTGSASPVSFLNFTTASPTINTTGTRAHACTVRCVQELTGCSCYIRKKLKF